ncbi:951_t:CDS:1, partial [Racocetra fulgida]
YTFTRPEKLRKHYKSKKNQCNIPNTRTQPSPSQNEVQERVQDPEVGPNFTTQAYREGITLQNVVQEGDIVFVKKSYDPARPHKNLKN